MTTERLQKFLASAGVGSRRKCEELISQGLVKVNGKVVTELGTKVDPRTDKVMYKNAYLNAIRDKVYLKMNKPKDYITTTNDPRQRKTVLELLPPEMATRVFPVGRLDRNTTGLLLFTSDGDLANKLLHPSQKIAKIYRVTVNGMLTKKNVEAFEQGIMLEDGQTIPAKVEIESYEDGKCQFLLTISEGRNRQVRRMCEAIEREVLALKRISIGGILLGNLAVGKVKALNNDEMRILNSIAGIKQKPVRKFIR